MSEGFALVMPFVVCESKGGPYPDQAFVAGWIAGTLDSELEDGPDERALYVYPELVPQIDLIAMRRGYQLRTEDAGEWTLAVLTRVP